MKKIACVFAGLFVCMAQVTTVFAEGARRDDGATAAKLQAMLRQVAAERDAAREETARVKNEVDELKKKLDRKGKEQESKEQKTARLNETIERYKKNEELWRERVQKDRERTLELVEKFRETVAVLKNIEQEKGRLQKDIMQVESKLTICSKQNDELYRASQELVDLYAKKSVWDALFQDEPVLGLKRVEIDNIVQENQSRLDKLQFVGNE